MSIAKATRHGALILALALICPQESQAETFTSAEFLKWKLEDQKNYLRISVGMASMIALQNDKKHAACIEEWYYVDERRVVTYILKNMEAYPDYHPRAILMGLMRKECGSFDYSTH